jgi:methionyl-tRNA formyltransferase
MAEEPRRGGGFLRILFWGTPLFALPSLRALGYEGHEVVGVVTRPDRPKGRGRKLSASPVKEVALEEGIPVLTPESPWGETFLQELRRLRPDISVVVAYGHILKPEVLEVPPGGSINVHASLLPELRGAAPVNWAILQGMETTGVSIIRMVEAMDAGPILLQTPEHIGPSETATELSTRLSEVGAEALIEALAILEAGAIEEEEQDHRFATFAPKVSREMARIGWNRGALELSWHVRGLDDVPGAWSTLEDKSIKLFRAMAESTVPGRSSPGTILSASPEDGLLVSCGEGALRVEEVQPAGGRRMPVGAWLRGHSITTQMSFE